MINIIYLIGPSCSGKDTIREYLLDKRNGSLNLTYLKPYTTRERRSSETKQDYLFLNSNKDIETFERNKNIISDESSTDNWGYDTDWFRILTKIDDPKLKPYRGSYITSIEQRSYMMYDKNNKPTEVYYGTPIDIFELTSSTEFNKIGVGTKESYLNIKDMINSVPAFTKNISIIPIYVYTDDYDRAKYAVRRARRNKENIREVFRRFIADLDDFGSLEKIYTEIGDDLFIIHNKYIGLEEIKNNIILFCRCKGIELLE